MKDRILRIGAQIFVGGDHFVNRERVGPPAVGHGDLFQFEFRFRQRDVQAPLSLARSFQEELKGERGFAGAWVTLYQVQVPFWETTFKDIVETCHTCPYAI